MLAIMRGERPPRPTHQALTNELWALTQHCWDQDPHVRPEMSKALKVLNGTQVSLSFRWSCIRKPYLFFVCSGSLPTTPYLHGFGSSSTLIVRQRPSLATLPGTAASHPPSLRHTGSTASHLTAQIPPQRSNHGINTLSPEHQGGSVRPDESGNVWLHGTSQAMIQDPPSDADRGHFGGQPSGRTSQSRQSTGESEPASPMPVDPVPFDLKTLQNGPAEHQIYGHPGGTGKSRTNPQNNLGASRMLLILIFPYPEPDTGGGSALNVGDGHHQGGQSQNPSRAFLCLIVFWRLMTVSSRHASAEQPVSGLSGTAQ
jgi:hypothetical protein